AGSIVQFVAENFKISILASDLQTYSKVLAAAVIERDKTLDSKKLCAAWIEKTSTVAKKSDLFKKAIRFEKRMVDIKPKKIFAFVASARDLCKNPSTIGPV